MTTIFLEYIWTDFENTCRSKTRVLHNMDSSIFQLSDCPQWTYDGSSTGQAETNTSDNILKPVSLFKDPFRTILTAYLVLCEVYNPDGTAHKDNYRKICSELTIKHSNLEPLFGLEQEYLIYNMEGNPYKWVNIYNPTNFHTSQGPFYCSSGGDKAFGRNIAEEHLQKCVIAGINIYGMNSEVMASQWEYQIGPSDPLKICDELCISRYILNRVSEHYNCWINYHPKPKQGWNGSGCHTNFSTNKMRNEGGYQYIVEACEKLKTGHTEYIKITGRDNDKRLSGKYETSNINIFNYGVGDRSSSIRIPQLVYKNGKGYLEDRRPASNIDPYKIVASIMQSVCE